MRELRQALLEAIGPEDVRALARKLVEQALEGEPHAQALVLQYATGKPEALPPEPEEGASERMAELFAAWANDPAQLASEREAELLGEIERLRLEQAQARELPPAAPRQVLIPGRVALIGGREVELERPGHVEAEPSPPARAEPLELEDVLADPRWNPC